MTPIDIFAVIFAIAVILKIIVAMIAPDWRAKKASKLMKHRIPLFGLYAVLLAVVAYYIFQVMTPAQVASVMLLASCAIGMVLVLYEKGWLCIAKNIPRTTGEILKAQWLNIILWLSFAVWVLWSIFA